MQALLVVWRDEANAPNNPRWQPPPFLWHPNRRQSPPPRLFLRHPSQQQLPLWPFPRRPPNPTPQHLPS